MVRVVAVLLALALHADAFQVAPRHRVTSRRKGYSTRPTGWGVALSAAGPVGRRKESLPFGPGRFGPGVFEGPSSLVDERGSCGVGFIAQPGKPPSHDVITRACGALGCMEHRGACAADGKSGDGSGILTDIPWALAEEDVPAVKEARAAGRPVGAGMIFMSRDADQVSAVKGVVEEAAEASGFSVLGWRAVPVDPSVLGEASAETVPTIEQVFVAPLERLVGEDPEDLTKLFEETARDDVSEEATASGASPLERALYLLRRRLRGITDERGFDQDWCYCCSFSSRTITYKGMVAAVDLPRFYKDLTNDKMVASFAIYHRRFSTNTMPKWPLAQPMRMLGHNGEINTLLGNVNWMRARASAQSNCDIGDILDRAGVEDGGDLLVECDTTFNVDLGPVVDTSFSDSANLDSIVELYHKSGRRLDEALMLTVPTAFENGRLSAGPQGEDAAVLDFHKFHSTLQEAWDGPALLVFSDGKMVGAKLDRNGLRPARVTQLKDGTVYMMSETGVVPLDEAEVVSKQRLGPGEMLTVDLVTGDLKTDAQVKREIAAQQPWDKRVKATQVQVPRLDPGSELEADEAEVLVRQAAFGWGTEDVGICVADMATSGIEATFSMGDDAPLSCLSNIPQTPYNYFRQRFAQVTNPPIDPLREGSVMSLNMALGKRGHVLNKMSQDGQTKLAVLESPVVNQKEMDWIATEAEGISTISLSTLYAKPDAAGDSDDPAGLREALKKLTDAAVVAVYEGKADVLVLSDKAPLDGSTLYVPPLVAVGAVHHALITAGLRMKTSLVVETGSCWTTHHLACLVGYGASAVHPYLAYDAVRAWHSSKKVQSDLGAGRLPADLTVGKALYNLRAGLEKGLLKILSKMGISLLSSYHGAQIFEALGVSGDLLELSFKGTPSRVGGLDTGDLGKELLALHARAFGDEAPSPMRLSDDGLVKPKASKEHHSNSPQLAKLLHKAVREKDTDSFREWSDTLQGRPLTALRDLLELAPSKATGRNPIDLDQVESVEAIMGRFCTGGMSLGALSRECHETLAMAMNRVGGKSNSGEGGEDKVRRFPLPEGDVDPKTGLSKTLPHLKIPHSVKDGDSASSKIKQVASGRFGVTPAYLVSGKQLEIKVAQGAKPGEGGQLPGPKVSGYIAEVRGSTPGVTLISPPPHHDIYSIEDLAQLIFDLKAVNPAAGVSVKLVAEPGIGTVAAGVAKANADVVQVSGHDGGTGASPLSSIKHAGSSWELGLAETHRTLVENGLRDKVCVRVDGGMRTGLDVIMGALLGGDEFGFGTVAMVAAGCVMARVCHLNTCPVGVTTQREDLRAKFPGTPEHVVNYLAFVAEEVRWYLASLGCKSLDELVGLGGELLQPKQDANPAKTKKLTTSFLTDLPTEGRGKQFKALTAAELQAGAVRANPANHWDHVFALSDASVQKCLEGKGGGSGATVEAQVINTDRAVGTVLSGEVARNFAEAGLPEGSEVTLKMTGSAGQSMGAFLSKGLLLRLEGEANDYVGKGMAGGLIAIVPPKVLTDQGWAAEDNYIVGNTVLYGATGGELFARGRAGERFAVRNSGATAVVEGTGDHCLEYMTNGAVAVLGPTGRNIGAGMTGGLGFFYDARPADWPEPGSGLAFSDSVNLAGVSVQRVVTSHGRDFLKQLVTKHHEETGSAKAKRLLDNWDEEVTKFWLVVPPSEKANPSVAEREETPAKEPALV